MFDGIIKIRDKMIPRVLLGTSPFIGAGQFGERGKYYYHNLYRKPHNMYNIIKRAWEVGVMGIQLLPYKPIVKALNLAMRNNCEMKIIGTVRPGKEIEDIRLLESLGAEAMVLHASLVDMLDWGIIKGILEMIKETGSIAGLATHTPSRTTNNLLESNIKGLFDIYMAPFNKLGYLMDDKASRIENLLMKLDKVIIAKKVLAAGALNLIEAFDYLTSHDCVDVVAIGVASTSEAEETFKTFLKVVEK